MNIGVDPVSQRCVRVMFLMIVIVRCSRFCRQVWIWLGIRCRLLSHWRVQRKQDVHGYVRRRRGYARASVRVLRAQQLLPESCNVRCGEACAAGATRMYLWLFAVCCWCTMGSVEASRYDAWMGGGWRVIQLLNVESIAQHCILAKSCLRCLRCVELHYLVVGGSRTVYKVQLWVIRVEINICTRLDASMMPVLFESISR